MDEADKTVFSLQGQMSDAFSARKNSVFGCLPEIKLTFNEPFISAPKSRDGDSLEGEGSDDVVTFKAMKGQESMFKKPMPKLRNPTHRPRKQFIHPSKQSHIPDFKKNPQKWVKYSLASTSEVTGIKVYIFFFKIINMLRIKPTKNQIFVYLLFTDKSNTAAALSFLKEIEERKRKHEPEEDAPDPSGKVVFKKPRARQDGASNTKTYREGKLCMPAFEFGSSKKTRSNKGKESSGSSSRKQSERTLSHLENEDEEEDSG